MGQWGATQYWLRMSRGSNNHLTILGIVNLYLGVLHFRGMFGAWVEIGLCKRRGSQVLIADGRAVYSKQQNGDNKDDLQEVGRFVRLLDLGGNSDTFSRISNAAVPPVGSVVWQHRARLRGKTTRILERHFWFVGVLLIDRRLRVMTATVKSNRVDRQTLKAYSQQACGGQRTLIQYQIKGETRGLCIICKGMVAGNRNGMTIHIHVLTFARSPVKSRF